MKIVLGSQSPRRKMLLGNLGFEFETLVSDAPEVYPIDLPVEQIAEYLARLKNDDLAPRIDGDVLLITADTLVVCNGKVIEKPKDEDQALKMLQILQENHHLVFSGVCLRKGIKKTSFTECSKVFMSHCSVDELRNYIEKWKPLDKAGSYGIQDWIGYAKVNRIEGCYYNVMGLPTARLYEEMRLF